MKTITHINKNTGKEETMDFPDTPKETAEFFFNIELRHVRSIDFLSRSNKNHKEMIEFNDKYYTINGRKIAKYRCIKSQNKFIEELELYSIINVRYDERIEFQNSVLVELEKINISN